MSDATEQQKYCLRWDSFSSCVTSMFARLRSEHQLVDMTLCCAGGVRLPAHKMLLSACSPYFHQLLKDSVDEHVVFVLGDTSPADVRALLDFVYTGRVSVEQAHMKSFLQTAEALQIRGLSGGDDEDGETVGGQPDEQDSSPRCNTTVAVDRVKQEQPTPPVSASSQHSAVSAVTTAAGDSTVTREQEVDVKTEVLLSEDDEMSSCLPAAPPAVTTTVPAAPVSAVNEQAISGAVMTGWLATGTTDYPALTGLSSSLARPHNTDTGFSGCFDNTGWSCAETGPRTGQDYVCRVCGKLYKSRNSLMHHLKKHEGRTTCPLCGKVCCIVAELRRHLIVTHHLSADDVRFIIPTQTRRHLTNPAATTVSGVPAVPVDQLDAGVL